MQGRVGIYNRKVIWAQMRELEWGVVRTEVHAGRDAGKAVGGSQNRSACCKGYEKGSGGKREQK